MAGVVIAAWQGLSNTKLLPSEAAPSPAGVIEDIWANWDTYAPNLGATLATATVGYILGNLLAVGAGIVFAVQPVAERLARGFNLIVFAFPPIALGPLLAIAFQGAAPQIILAALGVYFTTMTVTTVGLGQADPGAVALVRLYGGRTLSTLRWVRFRSALPTIMSGLKAGTTAAILGAMLAEFGSGAPGLGSFLLASMSLGEPARVWGIALVTTSTSLAAYILLTWVSGAASWRAVSTLNLGSVAGAPALHSRPKGRVWRFALSVTSIALPFLMWQMLPALLQVSPAIAKTPTAVWAYLVSDPDAQTVRQSIAVAAQSTLPMMVGGMVLGGFTALALALASDVFPRLGRLILFPVIMLQSTPLVALIPLIILLLGRGVCATLAIATSVCFFPAFVTLAQALKGTPHGALDILRVYGGNRLQAVRFVILPYLVPYLFAAARLIAPTALLGVMTAEWLATGYGLGGLMNEARGDLDYAMIWTVAALAVALAAGLYQLILMIERPTLRRLQTGL